MGALAEDIRYRAGSQGFSENMGDYDTFSPQEAVTRACGDRPTPVFNAPADLRYFDDMASVPPEPVSHPPTASQPYLTAVSMEPGAAEELLNQVENEFWESEPRYSTTSIRPLSLAPEPEPGATPSRTRRAGVKLLFVGLFSGVLALLTYEAFIVFDISRDDARAYAANLLAR